jgi:hypothetical protein
MSLLNVVGVIFGGAFLAFVVCALVLPPLSQAGFEVDIGLLETAKSGV